MADKFGYPITTEFLREHGTTRVSQQTFDFLSCLACRAEAGETPTAVSLEENDCVARGTTYGLIRRLADRDVIQSEPMHTGAPGRPVLALSLSEMPEAVSRELYNNRPCMRGEIEAEVPLPSTG